MEELFKKNIKLLEKLVNNEIDREGFYHAFHPYFFDALREFIKENI